MRLGCCRPTFIVNQTMFASVDNLLRGALDLLLPARCQYCRAPSADALALCHDCCVQLPWNHSCCPRCAQPQTHDQYCRSCLAHPPAFDVAWSAFRLEPPIHRSIHQLKYQARFLEARVLGSLMARQLRTRDDLPTWIVPVPLHAQRLRRRGYNQALELARVIARECGLQLHPHLARRPHATADQIGMNAVQRHRNVRDAFLVDADLRGRDVALIDDVMTTGATLDALARACKRAGAARVEAWCAARAA